MQHTTAIEITGGGRLYHVVVEDQVTGKQLLDKGNLKKRVTIIPLNKIDNKQISATKIQEYAIFFRNEKVPNFDLKKKNCE